MKAAVVNVRDYRDACIYVGRRMRGPNGRAEHPLRNPHRLADLNDDAERALSLAKYRTHCAVHQRLFAQQIMALAREVRRSGLPLGCWCHPKPCHAHFLAACVDRILGEPDVE